MSTSIHTLVEFVDGKPHTAMGMWGAAKTRSFTRKGSAENYREEILSYFKFMNTRRSEEFKLPVPDIRILTVQIPDDGELQDGMYPGLLAVPAVSWS